MSLANLFQWSAQIALIALAGAAAMRVMPVDAPVLRHAFWRALLVVGLALPILQPWTTTVTMAGTGSGIEVVLPPSSPAIVHAASAGPSPFEVLRGLLAAHWTAIIGFVLAAGIAARLAWLVAGILRLRRLCRAGQIAPPGGEYDDLARQIHVRAEIRYVPQIGQPVTFGLFRPVVLLPDSFHTLPPTLQRAVLAHELWHIRRRDWGWVLIEESVRAVLWFNPAVSWLVSKVQATREEVVDELTVQITNGRKAYLEALLVFADQPTLFPAAPLARRRHLFHRMLLISREAVMSSRRIVGSFAVASVVVGAAGWYGVFAFPLTAPVEVVTPPIMSFVPRAEPTPAPAKPAAQAVQSPPRDRRPGEAAPETAQEIEIKRLIQADPTRRDLYFTLVGLQQARGAFRDADVTLSMVKRAFPNDIGVLNMIASTYNRIGRFDAAMAALQEAAALDPTNPRSHQIVATFYWEKAFKDAALTPGQKLEYIHGGISATDRALTYDPDYVDALVYKNILLRMEAGLDPANAQSLIAQADGLRQRAMELQRARGPQGGVPGGVPGGVVGGVAGGVRSPQMEFVPAPGQPPPPPPPPPEPPPATIDGMTPLRVGGSIKPPIKLRDVKPIYPPIAQSAKVQGVVIIEAMIDTAGNIAFARVLRGQPLLDEAALDAVRQWQFEPTQINGVPTPIIMTVTVNFALQ
jgi:TonB family protein